VGWVGDIFRIIGFYLLGNRHRSGFMVSLAGYIIWAIYAYQLGMYDLVVLSVISAIIALLNWCKWRPAGQDLLSSNESEQ
jgi:hypothetical protein